MESNESFEQQLIRLSGEMTKEIYEVIAAFAFHLALSEKMKNGNIAKLIILDYDVYGCFYHEICFSKQRQFYMGISRILDNHKDSKYNLKGFIKKLEKASENKKNCIFNKQDFDRLMTETETIRKNMDDFYKNEIKPVRDKIIAHAQIPRCDHDDYFVSKKSEIKNYCFFLKGFCEDLNFLLGSEPIKLDHENSGKSFFEYIAKKIDVVDNRLFMSEEAIQSEIQKEAEDPFGLNNMV
ncbi:MAG: hypothetical protein EAY65_01445 [Alphaproteobacteria bacterium]|nr:MAG: hypothetical protein EAY65_01445 [Alphaproteobacteria bacterium]